MMGPSSRVLVPPTGAIVSRLARHGGAWLLAVADEGTNATGAAVAAREYTTGFASGLPVG
ncbi:MAG: hypothetical protein AAFP90_07860 [Planctomycetota bacterium]